MSSLKEDVLKAQQNGDIAKLYTLQQRAQNELNEDELGRFYANILDLALERLTETLEAARVMNMDDVQDFATLQALYEYALEHYSASKHTDASALFEILGGLSGDEDFSASMKTHQVLVDGNIDFEIFLNEMADLDEVEKNRSFYINVFTKKAQDLLDDMKAD